MFIPFSGFVFKQRDIRTYGRAQKMLVMELYLEVSRWQMGVGMGLHRNRCEILRCKDKPSWNIRFSLQVAFNPFKCNEQVLLFINVFTSVYKIRQPNEFVELGFKFTAKSFQMPTRLLQLVAIATALSLKAIYLPTIALFSNCLFRFFCNHYHPVPTSIKDDISSNKCYQGNTQDKADV